MSLADQPPLDIKASIAPLLSWIRQNAQGLRAGGRWPLQQEDIPANLLPQWQLYQANKQSLAHGSTKAPSAAELPRDKLGHSAGPTSSNFHPLKENTGNVAPHRHVAGSRAGEAQPPSRTRDSAGGMPCSQLPGTPIRPVLPDAAKLSPQMLEATPLSVDPKLRPAFISPTKELQTPTAAHKTSNSLLPDGPDAQPECIPATEDRPDRPATLEPAGHAATPPSATRPQRCLSAPRRALFASAAHPTALSSPLRPALTRKRRQVPVAPPAPATNTAPGKPTAGGGAAHSHALPSSNPCSPTKADPAPSLTSLLQPSATMNTTDAIVPAAPGCASARLPVTPSRLLHTHFSPATSPTDITARLNLPDASDPTGAATAQHASSNQESEPYLGRPGLPGDGNPAPAGEHEQRAAITPVRPGKPGGVKGLLGRNRQQAAKAPLVSPLMRRFGAHGRSPKAISFQASAAALERCLALESPRHRLMFKSPGKAGLPGPGLTSPLAGRRALLTSAAGGLMSPTRTGASPMLRAARYDISDVLLGSPSPWKAPRPDQHAAAEQDEAGLDAGQQRSGSVLQQPLIEQLRDNQDAVNMQQGVVGDVDGSGDGQGLAASAAAPAPAAAGGGGGGGTQAAHDGSGSVQVTVIQTDDVSAPSATAADRQQHHEPRAEPAAHKPVRRPQVGRQRTGSAHHNPGALVSRLKRPAGVGRRLGAVSGSAQKQSMGSRLLAASMAVQAVDFDGGGDDALGEAAHLDHLQLDGDAQAQCTSQACQEKAAAPTRVPARAATTKKRAAVRSRSRAVVAADSDSDGSGLQGQQQLEQLNDEARGDGEGHQAAAPRRVLRSRAGGRAAARYVEDSDECDVSEEEAWSPSAIKGAAGRRGAARQMESESCDDDDDDDDDDEACDMSEGDGAADGGASPAASPIKAKPARAAAGAAKTKPARAPKQPRSSRPAAAGGAADGVEPQPKRARVSRAGARAASEADIEAGSEGTAQQQADQGGTGGAGTAAVRRAPRGAAAVKSKAGGVSKPKAPGRTKKPAERMNFVKINQSGSRAKFSFNYQSKSAASGRAKSSRTRLRRINGKIVRVQFRAPAMAGQGGDVLEGFKSSTRCFICGQAGHWASRCPSLTGQAPEQLQRAETERADAEAAAGLAPNSVPPNVQPGQGPAGTATGYHPNHPAISSGVGVAAGSGRMGGGGGGRGGSRAGGAGGASRFNVTSLMPSRLTQAGALPLVSPDQPFNLQELLPPDTISDLAPVLGWDTGSAAPADAVLCTDAAGSEQAGGCADQPGTAAGVVRETGASVPTLPGVQGSDGSVQGVSSGQQQPLTCAQQFEAAARLSDSQLRGVLRGVWGHDEFRGNQLLLIRAAMEGRHVAGVLPTGAGKSLCYQLPALLLPGVTLVVSPLLALMRDQLLRLPPGVPGAMLWGGQTREEAETVLQAAAKGALKLLYIAPEKLHNPVVLDALKRLPTKIPLVCVDEAHCVSEWGHSFRPAYFRLGAVLRNVLKPRSIMALTATATLATQKDITQVLGLPQDALVRELPLRDNLRLQVVHMNGGTSSGRSSSWLMTQLKEGGLLAGATRVIAYVAFQAQADDVAQRLNKAGIHAVAYHAGKDMNERMRVQEVFSAGHARVVVATIAFGMGVDQQDLGAVVHMQMPRSMEDYVQQVGRAGRDGSEAVCYLLLDSEDYLKLRSLAHSAAAERGAVAQLLSRVFQPLQDAAGQDVAAGNPAGRPALFGVMPVKDACLELELDLEVIEAVMSNLQGPDGKGLIAVLPQTCTTLDIRFHHTAPADLARTMPLVRAIIAAKTKIVKGIYKVPMPKLVAEAGMSTSAVIAQLSELARKQEIHFEMSPARALAWRVVTRVMPDVDALADQLHARLLRQEQVNVRRLDAMYALMAAAAKQGTPDGQECAIRSYASSYFMSDGDLPAMPLTTGPAAAVGQHQEQAGLYEGDEAGEAAGCSVLPVVMQPDRLAVQVAAFLHSQQTNILQAARRMHGTAVARIFHGLATPAYPSDQWRKCGFWGRYSSWDFRAIVAAASPELNRMYGLADQETRRMQQAQHKKGGAKQAASSKV